MEWTCCYCKYKTQISGTFQKRAGKSYNANIMVFTFRVIYPEYKFSKRADCARCIIRWKNDTVDYTEQNNELALWNIHSGTICRNILQSSRGSCVWKPSPAIHDRITTVRISYFTRYLISPLSHYGWPAPILHKRASLSTGGNGETRTDCLIMPDAVYARKETKIPVLRSPRPLLRCVASETADDVAPSEELSDWKIDRNLFPRHFWGGAIADACQIGMPR